MFLSNENRDIHFLCSQLINKNISNNTLCCLSIEYIFLFIEIRYLITTQSILPLIVSTIVSLLQVHSQSNSKELEKCALHNFLLLDNIPLKGALTEIRDPFQQVGGYFNSKVGLGSMYGLNLQDFHL